MGERHRTSLSEGEVPDMARAALVAPAGHLAGPQQDAAAAVGQSEGRADDVHHVHARLARKVA